MSDSKILGKDEHYSGADRAEDGKPRIFQQIKRKIFIENEVLAVFHNGRHAGQRIAADGAFLVCVNDTPADVAFFHKILLLYLYETIIAYIFV